MANTSLHRNRLASETSPYLLQHQSNPVDWWPWGAEALAEAGRTNRPILLSIGYAACHWCHVMAHESFENDEIAAVMNALFVNIKVDREERPDIDQIYMAALHHLGEQGGWPLTMFLTPEGDPIWGGTYFPPVSRYGRPGFVDVLREMARLFRDEPQRIAQNRTALKARLQARGSANAAVRIGESELNNAALSIAAAMDPVHGGLNGAPKFPQCTLLEFLWRAGCRTGDDRFHAPVHLTLRQMSEGGIYDHLGGGYSRYSVDERWLVPHFEKMLYDNAQILDLLALAYAARPLPLFRQRAIETVDWLRTEMTTPGGGFSSSLDADSEGEEGRFYTWSLAEIDSVMGPDDAAFFAAKYDVSAAGNFEGSNILNRLGALPDSPEEAHRLGMLRTLLQQRRSKRVRPGLDDKTLADWNGLMIAALANSAAVFDRPDWLADARRGFAFVSTSMTRGDRLGHSWRADRLMFPGLASDYASMIRAALALYEATAEPDDLAMAIRWQQALDRHHADAAHGGYSLTADDAEGLIVRPHSTVDDAVPNHNGLIAQNLIRLTALTGDIQWRQKADATLERILPRAAENLFGHLSLLNALDMRLGLAEIVIVGNDAGAAALLRTARALPAATRSVVKAGDGAILSASHPAQAMIAATSGAAAFVCRGETCSLPVTTPQGLIELVANRHA